MIFDKITITNLFSYFGKRTFDLSGTESNKNIVLIQGRNGHGKTSFLNSLKLLFCGSDDPKLRQDGLERTDTSKVFGPKAFINGRQPYWEGIRNTQAVRHGEEDYSIEAEWTEAKKKVVARRSWPRNSNNLSGELEVYIDGKPAEDPNNFLEYRLPPDLVPYFFFDGERIREIAEAAEGDKMTLHVERLLDLRRVVDLIEQSSKVLNEFRKESASKDLVQEQLDTKARHASLLAERNKLVQNQEDTELVVANNQIIIDRLTRERDRIIEDGSLHDETNIREKQNVVKNRLEEACQRYMELATFDGFLSINHELNQQAISRLASMLNDESTGQRQLIEKLRNILPEELFGLPPQPSPRLTTGQTTFLRKKLDNYLNKMTEGYAQEIPWQISVERMQELYENFAAATSAANAHMAQSSEQLAIISKENQLLDKLEEELLEAGGIGITTRKRYEELKDEINTLIEKRGRLEQTVADIKYRIDKKDAQIEEVEINLRRIEKRINIAARGEIKVELLEKANRALDTYRKTIREQYRTDIEASLNKHFQTLMDSTSNITEIRLDEGFLPHFYDLNGDDIGRYSVSAGTKQIVATAFLWALQEKSDLVVPIIVDTPLARIDKRHQELLLSKFYPQASRQVIILPTDSELDKQKYSLINYYVYKEYQLSNSSGVNTEIALTQLYQ